MNLILAHIKHFCFLILWKYFWEVNPAFECLKCILVYLVVINNPLKFKHVFAQNVSQISKKCFTNFKEVPTKEQMHILTKERKE